jgi:mRNA interferase MazF
MSHPLLRADIVMVDLGVVPDQVKGHEQANPRPCLVVKPIASLQLAVIIPFTSKSKLSIYSVVAINKGQGGLTANSFALCHQIRTVSYSRIGKTIGHLPSPDFHKILTVLAHFLEIPV